MISRYVRPLGLAALLLAFAAAPVSAIPAHTADAVLTLEWLADEAPRPFRLAAPRPNPFTASTRLELSVQDPTDVTVAVFDALGRRVALLHEGALRVGTYALRLDAGDLPPGLYLIRATDGRGNTATRSVALVR
jgi:hypothetical protein